MAIQIDNLTKSFDELNEYLNSSFKSLENKTQAQVDDTIVNVINPMVNSRLELIREAVIKSFKPIYASFSEMLSLLQPLAGMSVTNLGSVISFITSLQNLLTLGVNIALPTITVEMPMLINTLMTQITNIMNFTPPKLPDIPSIENPDIYVSVNTDKLDIKCDPITMEDIMS